MSHILLNCLSVQSSEIVLFAFIQNMTLMCIQVYNLESYEYFQMGICKSFLPQFYFIDSQLRLYFSLLNSTGRFTFMESLIQMFPWMNKVLFTENNFLPRLIIQESFRSSHCIFQRVYTLNTRSINILRRSIVKVLITLLIKQ